MSKKNFKVDNPALSFISEQSKKEKKSKGYKLNPEYIETKSKRINLLIQPSLAQRAKEIANEQGISFNELVCTAVTEYIKTFS